MGMNLRRREILLSTLGLTLAGPAAAEDFPSYNTNPLPPDPAGMGSDAMALARRIRLGWNAGNALEAIGGETAWGNPPISKALIDLVKASGFDAVRLPCSWDQYANGRTARIETRWLDRVRDVVAMCIENDMVVLLNIHWDGGWLENNVTPQATARVNAKQRAFWEQIATHLGDFDERLMFASANEPNVENAEQMAVLHTYHQSFIDALRATGGRNAHRVLVLQGPTTDIEKTHSLWDQMPVDPAPNRLMMEVHFYTPWNFAGLTRDESWGHQFYYWGEGFHSQSDPARNATWGEEAHVERLFASMKEKFVDAGVPVIVGEYSATRRSNLRGDALQRHLASRAYYHRFVTERMTANGLTPFYWDNGGLGEHGCGIFDRRAVRIGDEATLEAVRVGAGLTR